MPNLWGPTYGERGRRGLVRETGPAWTIARERRARLAAGEEGKMTRTRVNGPRRG